jgi:CRP/FNR family transcriptional regulator
MDWGRNLGSECPVALLDCPAPSCCFPLRLAKHEGTKTAGGIAVTLPDNNQEVAAQIGTVRELVSRNLSRFEAEGLIDIDGRNLLIRDLKAIESEVSEES